MDGPDKPGQTGGKRALRIACPGGWVYIMTNRANGTLYTGVTADISRRVWEHREGLVKGFTRRYGLKRLVYSEFYESIREAIQRERNMKTGRAPGRCA